MALTTNEKQKIDRVISGVSAAYESLLAPNGMGIYTSQGSFYNHTIFGRDSSMTGRFITDIDHQTARNVIFTLASLQGTRTNKVTQEEPGRIHHEWRDFTLWEGSVTSRLMIWPWRLLWGASNKLLLTYYAVDSTATYIRLVHRYAEHIDGAILERTVKDKEGRTMTIGESVARAANWLANYIDKDGVFWSMRSNPFALPFQIYQDSVTAYARKNKKLAHYWGKMSYGENQAFIADALYDACSILPTNSSVHIWKQAKQRADKGLFDRYVRGGDPRIALDENGAISRSNISMGWLLNTASWLVLSEEERAAWIGAIVKRLFSKDFLTPVGLRTRALSEPYVLSGVIEYHGRQTVWPMFNFMVIEGLRRHRLYRLAEQLENRLINGLNITGDFDEFFVVDPNGTLMLEDPSAPEALSVQMKVEKNIAFSVVPALRIAHRRALGSTRTQQLPWQRELEDDVLSRLPEVQCYSVDDAKSHGLPVQYRRYGRKMAAVRTFAYFARQTLFK